MTSIAVEAARAADQRLLLDYRLAGRIADISWPRGEPVRSDELWRHTCFEAFVRAGPASAYYEFNFAPSGAWAAYRFTGYRGGMRIADEIIAPVIEAQTGPDGYRLSVALALAATPDLPEDATWPLALSSVIEEKNGDISYWALAHPDGKPDFHHADGFAVALAKG